MLRHRAGFLAGPLALAGCSVPPPAPPAGPQSPIIARGEQVFFEEKFGGNGRTCATCHRADRNFGIDAAFIATLPPDDPLFVAEFTPALQENLEKPAFMRAFGQILENQDGFDDLENTFNLRGVPHTLALRTSVDSPQGPRTGWSGDGAPGDGSLRSFAVGAVIQHFTKRLDRVAEVDFRLPTDEELDALEAFMLSLGRQEDLSLPLPLRGVVPLRGQEIFMDDTLGKCSICHANAGANAVLGGQSRGNANFNTGVEELPDPPAHLLGDRLGILVPPDDGFGIPGDDTFNTPPLVEAADTGPFFHNNSVETIEGAVAFYDGEAFNNSPAGQFLASTDPQGTSIELDATQIVAIAAFLRVINVLENIRQSADLLKQVQRRELDGARLDRAFVRALADIRDGTRVLDGGGLHPEAVAELAAAEKLVDKAACSHSGRRNKIETALVRLESARRQLIRTEDVP